MSISLPLPSATPAALKNRTWRINLETPCGQTGVVSVFQETVPVDASGNSILPTTPSSIPLTFTASSANIAALPVCFQTLPALMSAFGDYMYAQQNNLPTPASVTALLPAPTPAPVAAPVVAPTPAVTPDPVTDTTETTTTTTTAE